MKIELTISKIIEIKIHRRGTLQIAAHKKK